MDNTNTNLTKDEALELHKGLFMPSFRDYHSRTIDCIGLDRWLELVDTAQRDGRVPAKYFSFIVSSEMHSYNKEKQAHREQLQ